VPGGPAIREERASRIRLAAVDVGPGRGVDHGRGGQIAERAPHRAFVREIALLEIDAGDGQVPLGGRAPQLAPEHAGGAGHEETAAHSGTWISELSPTMNR
jgi:hypothetical protein